MKQVLRLFYSTTTQIGVAVRISRSFARVPVIGKAISILIDNLMLTLYGIELSSRTLTINKLIVGHSTGVVMGGNGIHCTGTLHLSSGVVFARRKANSTESDPHPFFDIDGDLFVGANSVLLGPLKIKGPVTIGALTLVSSDIDEPGVYVGMPARRLPDAVIPG